MIPDRFLELINQEIDGANTPEQSRRLRRYLEDHPEAQALYGELLNLGQMFDQAKPVDPPRQMRNRILAAAESTVQLKREPTLASSVLAAVLGRGRPKLAWAFGAGMIAGLLLFGLVSRYSTDVSPEQQQFGYGTINGYPRTEEVVATDRGEFDLDGARGTATVTYLAETMLVTLELESMIEVEIHLNLDPRVRFAGIRPRNGGDCRLSTTAGSVDLIHRGVGTYDLRFSDGTGSSMWMTVIADGEVQWERTFGGRR